jgi:hypothetical protein
VPRAPSLAGPRVLQRLELKSLWRQANFSTVSEELLAVGRNEMRHLMSLPSMAVKPESTVHGVDHPISPPTEFSI